MRTLQQRRLVWSPVAAWTAVIVIVLTRTSQQLRPLRPVINIWTGVLAHLLLFGVLGYLIGRALRIEDRLTRPAIAFAFVACVALGVATEGLQAFATGRSPLVWDVGLDAAGAAGGLALAWLRGRGATPVR